MAKTSNKLGFAYRAVGLSTPRIVESVHAASSTMWSAATNRGRRGAKYFVHHATLIPVQFILITVLNANLRLVYTDEVDHRTSLRQSTLSLRNLQLEHSAHWNMSTILNALAGRLTTKQLQWQSSQLSDMVVCYQWSMMKLRKSLAAIHHVNDPSPSN